MGLYTEKQIFSISFMSETITKLETNVIHNKTRVLQLCACACVCIRVFVFRLNCNLDALNKHQPKWLLCTCACVFVCFFVCWSVNNGETQHKCVANLSMGKKTNRTFISLGDDVTFDCQQLGSKFQSQNTWINQILAHFGKTTDHKFRQFIFQMLGKKYGQFFFLFFKKKLTFFSLSILFSPNSE